MLLVLLAAFLWTYVLAVFCEVATNAHPANTLFNQRLDGLNAFIKHNEVCLWIACGHAPLMPRSHSSHPSHPSHPSTPSVTPFPPLPAAARASTLSHRRRMLSLL